MHRLAALLLALTLFGAGRRPSPRRSALAGGPCTGSEVEVRGRVTDAATGLPLNEMTSVEIVGVSLQVRGRLRHRSRQPLVLDRAWSPGTYKIKFVADSYRPEWYDDQPNLIGATVIDA